MKLRRALALSAVDRYASMVIGALVVAVMSRILSPYEVGVTVLGMSVFMIVDLVRDVPTTYLVQRHELTPGATRAAFSVMLLISILAAVALCLAAPWLATYQGEPGLVPFFEVLARALLLGPFERPATAMFRRVLDFDKVAIVNVSATLTNALLAVGLAVLDFSYMSYAWALLGSNLVALTVARLVSDRRVGLGITVRGWAEALRIGGGSALWGLICRLTETVPHFVFTAYGQLGTVGLYGRAQLVADMPGKLLFSAIWPVALPALAAHQRSGAEVKRPVLDAIGLLSAFQWPGLLVVACLAHPITLLLLGSRWIEIVPVVQVLILARLFAPLDVVVYPLLMSQGRTLRLVVSALLPVPLYLTLIPLAAFHGLMAVALCYLLLVPFNSAVGFACIRGPLQLGLREVGAALRKSFLTSLTSLVGPLLVIAAHGFRFDLSIGQAVVAGALAAAGWALGLAATRHPLCYELLRIVNSARQVMAPRLGVRP